MSLRKLPVDRPTKSSGADELRPEAMMQQYQQLLSNAKKEETMTFEEFKMKRHSELLRVAEVKEAQKAISLLMDKMQDFGFRVTQLEARNELIDNISRQMQITSTDQRISEGLVNRAISEFKLHISHFQTMMEVFESEVDNAKRTTKLMQDTLDNQNNEYKHKNDAVFNEMIDFKNDFGNYKNHVQRLIGQMEQKVNLSQRKFNEVVERNFKLDNEIGVKNIQIELIEKQIKQLKDNVAYFQPIDRRITELETKYEQFDPRLTYLQKKTEATDVFIERYLPVKVYNQIFECLAPNMPDFGQSKSFHEFMKALFQKTKLKILKEEASINRNKSNLKKNYYAIPKIEIPQPPPKNETPSLRPSEIFGSGGNNFLMSMLQAQMETAYMSQIASLPPEDQTQAKLIEILSQSSTLSHVSRHEAGDGAERDLSPDAANDILSLQASPMSKHEKIEKPAMIGQGVSDTNLSQIRDSDITPERLVTEAMQNPTSFMNAINHQGNDKMLKLPTAKEYQSRSPRTSQDSQQNLAQQMAIMMKSQQPKAPVFTQANFDKMAQKNQDII